MESRSGAWPSYTKQRQVFQRETRELISKVMGFMDAEACAGTFVIDCNKVRERVEAATGASEAKQTAILEEIGTVYQSQTRQIIFKVMNFMEMEANAGKFLIDCRKVRDRVAAATGASKSTQLRIVSDEVNQIVVSEYTKQ